MKPDNKIFLTLLMSASLMAGAAALQGQTPGTLKWAYQGGSGFLVSAAISNDDIIYTGALDGNLCALNPDKSLRWIYNAGDPITTDPAIGIDGTIYLASEDFRMHAVTLEGRRRWTFKASAGLYSTPAIGNDGTIYFGSYADTLYALHPDGSLKWSFRTGGDISASPAIGQDGTIYISGQDNFLYAINPDGTLKWKLNIGTWMVSSPALAQDGTIYIGLSDGTLRAVTSGGRAGWIYTTGGPIYSSPAIDGSGTIYVGSDDSKLHAINPDGSSKWTFQAAQRIRSSPAIDADNIIYVGSWDHNLYAINPDGSRSWSYATGNAVVSSPAIGRDGTIYFGSIDQKFYALYGSGRGLAESSWPKYHATRKNTGNPFAVVIENNPIPFTFVTGGMARTHLCRVSNETVNTITITTCDLGNPAFTLHTSMPRSLPPGSSCDLELEFIPDHPARYSTSLKLEWSRLGAEAEVSTTIQEDLFLEDGGETARTANVALEAYHRCEAKNANSAATLNNLAILYRLLGEYDLAAVLLQQAVSIALTDQTNYAGIEMNQGVVHSDQKSLLQARAAWASAAVELAPGSCLAAQIHYDLAHAAYAQDSLDVALAAVNRTLAAESANTFLRAKAHVLRGAIRYRLAGIDSSRADFTRAQSLDPDGPIGQMARENLDALNTDVTTPVRLEPEAYALLANYPNPFNPVTRLRFALPQPGEVVIEISSLTGQRVRRLLNAPMPAGWHETEWNGCDDQGAPASSGIYLCTIRSARWQAVQKMTLIR